jgi:hypothetical protein
MQPQNSIAKGKILEKFISQKIREKGLDRLAMRQIGSGNSLWKGDINTKMKILGRPAIIECKNQKTLHISEWWRQTEKQVLGYGEPILIFKEFNQPLEAAKAVLYYDTLLDLIKKSQDTKLLQYNNNPQEDRQLLYDLNGLRLAIKRVEKHFEKSTTQALQ